jgi:AraC-like DNA-binding protein
MDKTDLNSLIIALIYGSLILLSFLKISNPLKVNKKANFWFGIFLFIWSTFWVDDIFLYLRNDELHAGLAIFIRFVQFFTPLIFYFSVVFFTNPNFRFKKADFKYLALPVLFLVLSIVQNNDDVERAALYKPLLSGLILFHALIYAVASYLKIRRHRKNILLFSSATSEINLSWLENIITLILTMSVIFSIYNLAFNASSLNLYINCIFLVAIFTIGYYSLKQKEIFPVNEKHRNEIISLNEETPSAEMKRKIIADEELVRLKSKLTELMRSQKPYLDSELNLIKLAEITNITPHQLSYLLNTGFNESFFLFINKYRVEKAKELLLKEEMNNLSILGIAFESGFNSKTSFNSTFKKITNQTPSEFKRSGTAL